MSKQSEEKERVPKFCKGCGKKLIVQESEHFNEYTGKKQMRYVCAEILKLPFLIDLTLDEVEFAMEKIHRHNILSTHTDIIQ